MVTTSIEESGGCLENLASAKTGVRFVRRLAYSPEDVWRALTEPAKIATHFPGLKLECRVGGQYSIDFDVGGEGTCEGGEPHIQGEVAQFESERCLQCGTIRWELEPTDAGCDLTFTDILVFGNQQSKDATAKSVLAGWHWYLDALETVLDGKQVDWNKPEPDYSGYHTGLTDT